MATTIIKTLANQTVYDLALVHYGTSEAISRILADNPDISNDPAALIALGIDPLSDDGYYLDVAIRIGSQIAIERDYPAMDGNTVRALSGGEVTTFAPAVPTDNTP